MPSADRVTTAYAEYSCFLLAVTRVCRYIRHRDYGMEAGRTMNQTQIRLASDSALRDRLEVLAGKARPSSWAETNARERETADIRFELMTRRFQNGLGEAR